MHQATNHWAWLIRRGALAYKYLKKTIQRYFVRGGKKHFVFLKDLPGKGRTLDEFWAGWITLSFGAGNKKIDPHVILAMPFNFILSSSHSYYRNTQFFYYGNAT